MFEGCQIAPRPLLHPSRPLISPAGDRPFHHPSRCPICVVARSRPILTGAEADRGFPGGNSRGKGSWLQCQHQRCHDHCDFSSTRVCLTTGRYYGAVFLNALISPPAATRRTVSTYPAAVRLTKGRATSCAPPTRKFRPMVNFFVTMRHVSRSPVTRTSEEGLETVPVGQSDEAPRRVSRR